MTAPRASTSRTELAVLLTEAAQGISSLLSAEYPTPASRSYLQPVLGTLSAAPRVVAKLTDRLDALYAEPLPTSSAGLLTLASYASALGWLTESLVILTETVDLIPSLTDGVTEAAQTSTEASGPDGTDVPFTVVDVHFTDAELATISRYADATGLTTEGYLKAAGLAHAAALKFRTACAEIISGLHEDAAYLQQQAIDRTTATDQGPGGLPTLVRSLLARMETTA